MMNRFLLVSAALMFALAGFAQHHEKCGSHLVLQQQLQDPETKVMYEDFQDAIRRYTQDPKVAVQRENGVRVIPVVFHILHGGGNENIDKEKVLQQMEVLNEDYRRLNPDTVNTPERFYGDTEYTHLTFSHEALDDFLGDSSFIRLNNRYGQSYAFHFLSGNDSIGEEYEGEFDRVIEMATPSEAELDSFGVPMDSTFLPRVLTDSINTVVGLSAEYVRDTTVLQAPNFTVDGAEVTSLSYTTQPTFHTVFVDGAPTFLVDGAELDSLRYTTTHTFTTEFNTAAPSFTVDGVTMDTLFYTTEHTYTTSWNGTDTDTTYADTLQVELFEDVNDPLLPTDTLEVFPANITYDVFDGSGAVIGTNGFLTEDTLILSYTILSDTVYSDTLLVELFEDSNNPYTPTGTLNVFSADLNYYDFDESGTIVQTYGFTAEDTLVLDYYVLADTVYSDTLTVVLFEDAQDPFAPTGTLTVFQADIEYWIFDGNGDTLSVETFVEEGNLQLEYTEVVLVHGDHRVNIWTDGLGYTDDVLVSKIWPIAPTIDQQGKYVPADCRIEFRLATKDPLGNCTDGIVRVFTPLSEDVNDGTGFKGESYWNAYSYLNVWVVNSIDVGSTQGTTLGYAQFPGTGLLSTDGITVIDNNIDVRNSGGRTATHEVGHWLSLIHTWGDANCGSDDVLDTPVAAGPNFGVCGNNPDYLNEFGGSSTYHDTPYNVPGCDPDNPDGEMFGNYMDYSDDRCQNIFTLGQKARMDYTLEGDGSSPGIRSYLISQENLELTGVADPYSQPDCAPISDFYFDQGSQFRTVKMICVNEEVDFEEASYNGVVTDYLWTFEGGNPDEATTPNASTVYENSGVFDVSLMVKNGVGEDTHTEENMIIVSPMEAQFDDSDWGYVDSYWSEQAFLDNYVVFNQDNSDNKWEWYHGTDGGYTGSESVRIFNIDNKLDAVDELISPSYDLSALDEPTLKFRYSGAAIDNTPADKLEVRFSDDCGESWGPSRLTLEGSELTNAGLVNGSYRPNQNSTWSDVTVNLGPDRNKPNVRVMFRWISGQRGNNFYIDDVTLATSPIGMQDLERQIDLKISPNPTLDVTSVTMRLIEASEVRMEILDMLGKTIQPVLVKDLTNGPHRFVVDMSRFTSGVYYLRIMVDGDMLVKKVVKN